MRYKKRFQQTDHQHDVLQDQLTKFGERYCEIDHDGKQWQLVDEENLGEIGNVEYERVNIGRTYKQAYATIRRWYRYAPARMDYHPSLDGDK